MTKVDNVQTYIVHSRTIPNFSFRWPENKNTKFRSNTLKIYSPGYWATIADSAMRVKSVRTQFEDQTSLYTRSAANQFAARDHVI